MADRPDMLGWLRDNHHRLGGLAAAKAEYERLYPKPPPPPERTAEQCIDVILAAVAKLAVTAPLNRFQLRSLRFCATDLEDAASEGED